MPGRMAPSGVDNFELSLTQEPKGYYSSVDPTTCGPNLLVRGSQNVYKDSNGNIANRFGARHFIGESIDATIAGVKAAFVWNTSLSKIYPLRIANSKLEVLSDIVTTGTYVWYTLLSSLATTRGVFDTWWNNTLKKDQLLFVIGDTSMRMWSGGVGVISSTTSNTIVLTATVASSGFNTASGSVLINGNTYTYSGSSASTLTGVSGDPTGEANGSVVLQAIVTTTTSPAAGFINDFIKVIGNRLHVGSYTSRLTYISSNSDYTDFSVPSPRTAGSAELITLDSPGKGIGTRGSSLTGNAHIFSGTSTLSIVTYEAITVGTTLTEKTNVDVRQIGVLASALAHEFIDTLGDSLIWLSQDQQVRAYGIFRNLSVPTNTVLSQEVSSELQGMDFTGGELKIISTGQRGDIIYLTAPLSGTTYLHQTKNSINSIGNVISERLWHTPFIWGISRISVFGTDIIGFSNANPQTYLLWDTNQWHDDSPSGDVPFVSVMLMSYRNFGRRQGKFKFDKFYIEGYMTTGTALLGAVYLDYQGASGLLNPTIHDPNSSPANNQSFFTGVTPPSLGDGSLGDNPLGSPTDALGPAATTILDHDLLPKFRIIVPVQLSDCYEYALMTYSQSLDARWEIIAIGVNASESPNQAVEIIKVQ